MRDVACSPVPNLDYIRAKRRYDQQSCGRLVTTFDAFAAAGSVPAPDFVKIDVDGGELQVLEGMQALMRTRRPVVFVEVHDMDREQLCRAYLTARGYAVLVIRDAWWRAIYPERRLPVGHNQWLLAVPA